MAQVTYFFWFTIAIFILYTTIGTSLKLTKNEYNDAMPIELVKFKDAHKKNKTLAKQLDKLWAIQNTNDRLKAAKKYPEALKIVKEHEDDLNHHIDEIGFDSGGMFYATYVYSAFETMAKEGDKAKQLVAFIKRVIPEWKKSTKDEVKGFTAKQPKLAKFLNNREIQKISKKGGNIQIES